MKKILFLLGWAWLVCLPPGQVIGQVSYVDSLFQGKDTTAVLDSLLADFEQYLDSMNQPRSFFLAGTGWGNGYFSYQDKNTKTVNTRRRAMVYPSLSYYHKKGWGITTTAYGVFQGSGLQFYQLAVSPSFDLLRQSFSTGVAYTHYVNRDSTAFYQTPIRNELFTYFTYKKWRVRPAVSMSFGWGNHSTFQKERQVIISRRLASRDLYYLPLSASEPVWDFSMTFSLRKDFRWNNVLSEADQLSLTPVVLLSAGTQQYGFNTSLASDRQQAIRPNALPSNNQFAANSTGLAPQSASFIFRITYLKGKCMLQPQYVADYYLPSTNTRRWTGVCSLYASFLF